MNTGNRTIGALEQRFNAIMNSRFELFQSHAGTPIRCKVSGNPKLGYWDERISGFDGKSAGALKDIYSFNVNKMDIVNSAWFNEDLDKAIALETAGQLDEAAKLFDELMNASQLTLGVINRDGTKQQFASNQVVDVVCVIADVADRDAAKNKLATTHKAIVADSLTAVGAVTLSKSKRWGAAPVVETVAPASADAAIAALESAVQQ